MANENALVDQNNRSALLLHSFDGTETRKAKAGASGGVLVEESQSGKASVPYRTISLLNVKQEVSSVAAYLMGYYISNRAGAERFVKIWFKPAASVTVGTTAPDMTIPLAAAQSANLSNMAVLPAGATGITIAATTGIADSDVAAPTANDVVANIFTKVV